MLMTQNKTKQKIMVVIGGVFFYWMLPRHAPAPFSLTGKLKYFFIFILYDTLYSRE